MQPNRIGRLLGIGTRVAAGRLREGTVRAAAAVERASASAPAATTSGKGTAQSAPVLPAVRSPSGLAEGSRRFARGAGRFGASLWKPFAHATGLLTLQITGLLFAFFALGFGAKSWQLYRASGWRDHHLPLYLGFAVLFAWFAASSFWRAARRQKRG